MKSIGSPMRIGIMGTGGIGGCGGAKLAGVCAENAVGSLDLNRTIYGSAQLASEIDFRFRTFRLHFLFPEHRANLRRVADGGRHLLYIRPGLAAC